MAAFPWRHFLNRGYAYLDDLLQSVVGILERNDNRRSSTEPIPVDTAQLAACTSLRVPFYAQKTDRRQEGLVAMNEVIESILHFSKLLHFRVKLSRVCSRGWILLLRVTRASLNCLREKKKYGGYSQMKKLPDVHRSGCK